jgi:hypothetical protein
MHPIIVLAPDPDPVVCALHFCVTNVKCEASRHFRNKKREYLKDKVNELETVRTGTCQTYMHE